MTPDQATHSYSELILGDAGILPDVADEVCLDELGVDRLALLEVIRRLERMGSSSFPPALIESLCTVGDLRYYIRVKQAHQS